MTPPETGCRGGEPELLALGLNPAWQKTLFFTHLQPGEVNRARSVLCQASGKGINFVEAVRRVGGRAVVLQFAGGVTGEWVAADLDRRGLPHVTVRAAAATRVCTTLLSEADGGMTELIEPSGTVRPDELAALRAAIRERLPAAAGVALCGTFPPGVPEALYAETAAAARAAGLPVLLDGHRGVLPTLAAGVDILKINASELKQLAEETDLAAAAAACLARFPRVRLLAVTAGGAAAYLFTRAGVWEFGLPRLERVVNPIGAGDTVGGVLLHRLVAAGNAALETAAPDAFRFALACASASCLTAEPARFDPAAAADLAPRITVRCP